jgi:hypothetical protein
MAVVLHENVRTAVSVEIPDIGLGRIRASKDLTGREVAVAIAEINVAAGVTMVLRV